MDYTAAGVLPYCILGGDVLFLIGKEKFFMYRKTGDELNPSERILGLLWSDFGGRRETSDLGVPEVTAAREFAEETFGAFEKMGAAADSIAMSNQKMLQLLKADDKKGKEVFQVWNGQYTMFVAPVPYVDDLLLNLARDQCVASEENVPVAEKLDYTWVPADMLLALLENNVKKSRRGLCVEVGASRVLHLFHKFVFTLYNADLRGMLEMITKFNGTAVSCSPGASGADIIRPERWLGRKRLGLGMTNALSDQTTNKKRHMNGRKRNLMKKKSRARRRKQRRKLKSMEQTVFESVAPIEAI